MIIKPQKIVLFASIAFVVSLLPGAQVLESFELSRIITHVHEGVSVEFSDLDHQDHSHKHHHDEDSPIHEHEHSHPLITAGSHLVVGVVHVQNGLVLPDFKSVNFPQSENMFLSNRLHSIFRPPIT